MHSTIRSFQACIYTFQCICACLPLSIPCRAPSMPLSPSEPSTIPFQTSGPFCLYASNLFPSLYLPSHYLSFPSTHLMHVQACIYAMCIYGHRRRGREYIFVRRGLLQARSLDPRVKGRGLRNTFIKGARVFLPHPRPSTPPSGFSCVFGDASSILPV